MKYGQLFSLLLFCIANINLASANVNNISSHANPPTSVTVYFNANGGNSANMPASVSVEYGSMYGDVTGTWNWDASKSGYYFIGWNTAADASGYFVGPVSHCAETTTHTLYAIFEEAPSQDVSLCPDGSAVISASSGSRQYEWLTTAGLDDASSQRPTLSASALTPGNTYDYVCKLEASNCIYNYDFNLGNVGFYSDYQWSDTTIVEKDNLYKQRTYGYISDAHNAHPAWFNIRSHNNDGGKFMICNGGALPDDIVWEEAVKVEPNTNYVFSVWAANVFIEEDTAAAELQLYVNGTAISGITKVIYHDWIKIEAQWSSGSNQYAALQIKNHATRDTGNDFGLDDIEFYPADGSYDTITVTVNPTFTPGAISSTGQTIHQGGTADTIGNVTSAAGGDGNISYQWFEGSNAIEGATSASYKPGSAYTETMGVYTFTRKAKDATCATTFTTSEGSYVLTTIEPVHTVLGLTRTGKEVDCSTMDPEEDKTITEHGKIVTSPRVTRNGKIITEECSGCGTDLSITDTVDCTSITLKATITDGDPTSAILKMYSDAAHTSQLGSDISAIISDDKISAVAANLNCHTRYYFLLETTEGTETCTFDWTDSTRDMTMEKVTTCTIASVRALSGGSDLSHEHLAEGTTDQIDSVYDHEGNAYAVVQIGEQCWLKENMRCTTSPRQGTGVGQINLTEGSYFNSSEPYYYQTPFYFTSSNVPLYGYLYNYVATIDTVSNGNPMVLPTGPRRGICPKGWHVPTEAEWVVLDNKYASNPSSDWARGDYAAKVTTCQYWPTTGTIGAPLTAEANAPGDPNAADHNISGLSILPAGGFIGSGLNTPGLTSYHWTATPGVSYIKAYARTLYFFDKNMYGSGDVNACDGHSVRCVRDKVTPSLGICDDNYFGEIKLTDVADVSKVEVIDTHNNIVATDNAPAEGNTFKGLPSGTYTVRAISPTGDFEDQTANLVKEYTHCTVGSLHTNEMGATTTQLDSVRDHEGNWYEVVQIGNQCWLKENMRARTLPSNPDSSIVTFTSMAVQNPHAYYYDLNEDYYDIYGCLYNYNAAMDFHEMYPTIGSYPHRGICPEGWHIPQDWEWVDLELTVSPDTSDLNIETKLGWRGASTDISARLATSCLWQGNSGAGLTPIAYANPNRNSSGFSALPAGHLNISGDFLYVGGYAVFWCAEIYAPADFRDAYTREIADAFPGISRQNYFNRVHGLSVRCVRDN